MGDINKGQFCNSEFDGPSLYKIIESFYPIGIENIKLIYEFFINSFEGNSQNDEYRGATIRDISEIEKIRQNFFIAKNAKYLGIDFPTWVNFYAEGSQKKRIMIVGIDPLRSEECKKEKIEIGTPYGFHDTKIRNKMERYWNFIELLSDDYSIYLTDTFKVFYYKDVKTDLSRSYKDKDFTHPQDINDTKQRNNDIHQIIFKKEVELINPHLIITLGHIPRIWFSEEKKGLGFEEIKRRIESNNKPQFKYYDIPILPLPHLSGRSINDAKNFVSASLEDLPKLYCDYAINYLKRTQS